MLFSISFSNVESLFDLTGKQDSDILEIKYIYELRSMIYINNGNNFTVQALPNQAQMSTVEDIFVENNQLVFTGNYYGFVTELGESSSNSGSIITLSHDGSVNKVESLNLPKDFSGRKIIKLNEDNYLILSNNGKSYIVNSKNQEIINNETI